MPAMSLCSAVVGCSPSQKTYAPGSSQTATSVAFAPLPSDSMHESCTFLNPNAAGSSITSSKRALRSNALVASEPSAPNCSTIAWLTELTTRSSSTASAAPSEYAGSSNSGVADSGGSVITMTWSHRGRARTSAPPSHSSTSAYVDGTLTLADSKRSANAARLDAMANTPASCSDWGRSSSWKKLRGKGKGGEAVGVAWRM
eukprot:113018-Chlamydomonas_euryale.AAC.2